MSKMKYNVRVVDRNNREYVFVTRGRSKPFSDEEVEQYFGDDVEEVDETDTGFRVEGHLRRIFAQDLQFGLKHCSQKYGISEGEVLREANRLFPQQNLDRIIGTLVK